MTYHIQSKEFLVGAVVGSLLGTVSALLVAPKSGKRLRQDLCNIYGDACECTHDFTCKACKKGKCLIKNLGSQTSDLKDRAKDKVEDVREGLKDWFNPTEETTKDLAIGSLVGGVVGIVAGLLLAPKSGDELRQDIVDTYEDLTEKTQDAADQLTKRGKLAAKNVQSQVGDWFDFAKQIAEQLTSQLSNKGEEVAEKGKQKIQSTSNRINDVLEWAALGARVWQGLKKER